MDLIWLLILVVVIVGAILLLRPFRHGTAAFFWPWYNAQRDDRAQLAYLAEEEMKREAEDEKENEGRDLAP
ncbi:MAG TPA: hypothetical protein VI814_12165 [Candidatus Limnocylindria bacterium]